MVQIRWTNLAVEDLRGVYDFISRDSIRYARIQVVKIRARVKVLKRYPLYGKIVPEYKDDRY